MLKDFWVISSFLFQKIKLLWTFMYRFYVDLGFLPVWEKYPKGHLVSSCMFNFMRTTKNVSHSSGTILYSFQQSMNFFLSFLTYIRCCQFFSSSLWFNSDFPDSLVKWRHVSVAPIGWSRIPSFMCLAG